MANLTLAVLYLLLYPDLNPNATIDDGDDDDGEE